MNCSRCKTEFALEDSFCEGCGLDLRVTSNEDKALKANRKYLSRGEEWILLQKKEFLLHNDSWVMEELALRELTMRGTQEQFDEAFENFDPTGLSKEERSHGEIGLWVKDANRGRALEEFNLIEEEAEQRGLIEKSRGTSGKVFFIACLTFLLFMAVLNLL